MSDQDDDRQRPSKVRYSKLQEVQLPPLEKLDRATTAMYHEIGFDAAEVPPRSQGEFASLGRSHAVHVAEADYEVAGYVAWRDQSPGVGYIDDVSVHPDYQRFGIGRGLFERVEVEARDLNMKELVLKVWDRADWAVTFYRKLGFAPIDSKAPERVRAWLEERTSGQPFVRPGETPMWVAIRPAPKDEEDDEPEDE